MIAIALLLICSVTTDAIDLNFCMESLPRCINIPEKITSAGVTTLLPPPMSAEEMNIKLLLYTQEHPDTPQAFPALNPMEVHDTDFDPSKATKINIYGWNNNAEVPWVIALPQAILSVEDVNCIVVDWRKGSETINYLQAASNTRVVGVVLANFLCYLQKTFPYSLLLVHMMGHSLGAHIAGFAGQYCRGVGRISGMDPAGQLFIGVNADNRLDPSDAIFVDVIYCNETPFVLGIGILFYGTYIVSGHVNFYVNGGMWQPGCKAFDIANNNGSCSHGRCHELYIESVGHPGAFHAYDAASYDDFQEGGGFPWMEQTCNFMGYYAYPTASSPALLYLNTNGEPPFRAWRIRVEIEVTISYPSFGSITFTLEEKAGISPQYDIYRGGITSDLYSTYLDVWAPGPPFAVTVSWSVIFGPMVTVTSVFVVYGHTAQGFSFCPSGLEDGSNSVRLVPCM
ncbi:inactive pancreatic lipase-related protein 1-like [Engystomops pustulosus]|uniref:inactive pancreatic lipase-related protein 1-like n=1 Tax=Engystomops pustulosus TaxID=76066 RepID=UPI003AFA4369